MNILPLVIAFILIFGGIAVTFLRDAKCFAIMEMTFESAKNTQRTLNNLIVKNAYRKFNGDPIAKKEGGQKLAQPGPFLSRRQLFPPYEESKMDLGPLFKYEGEIKLHPLYESLAELLRLLYQKNLFSKLEKKEKIEYRILDALLFQGCASKETGSLSDLFPEEAQLQKLYYKMLKGTSQYDEEKGYPPLSDFFCIGDKNFPLSLSLASPRILQALFGNDVKDFILKEEEKKWSDSGQHVPIAQEELRSYILSHTAKAGILSIIEPFLDPSKQSPVRESISEKDHRTGITLRAEL